MGSTVGHCRALMGSTVGHFWGCTVGHFWGCTDNQCPDYQCRCLL
ncbi:unnamed protein product [Staurois parvus]|uniref:Uncharacterized protein n=1 Tax=Staurois parvus TaxID=386267 RepID=A0ABN9CKK4_9NEOB|nr:unnamed protein product [Staurois parvus]